MADIWAMAEFDSMAENAPPSCDDVRRLLEGMKENERLILEKHLNERCQNWGFNVTELTFSDTLPCVYSDGVSTLKRASDGTYLMFQNSDVSGYSNNK
jgi:hypothetical protein